jgi:hypothetical protein
MSTWLNRRASGGPCGELTEEDQTPSRSDSHQPASTKAGVVHRALQEAFARLCQCDPNNGYSNPKFTSKTFAHVFFGGHTSPMFSDQSYFAFGTTAGQALVDQVVALAATQPRSIRPEGDRDVCTVFFGRDIGMARDPANPNGPMISGQYVRMVVEKNNCASRWKYNEVVTIYPRVTATP